MRRVLVLAEGQTEEAFVGRVLYPHFLVLGLALRPVVIATKRVKAGGKFKGGITSYQQVRHEVRLLLNDSGVVAVTTMIDLYGLPDDFPGKSSLPPGGSCYDRLAHLEQSFGAEIDHPRFTPYLSLHEFEALLLVSPEEIGKALPEQPSMTGLAAEISGLAPEEINEGPETHPAARIRRVAPGYRKVAYGPTIAARIGLAAIRERCSHFDRWLRRLEDLARRA